MLCCNHLKVGIYNLINTLVDSLLPVLWQQWLTKDLLTLKCGIDPNTFVLLTGPNHYPLAAVPGKSRAVQEHPATGVGAPREAAAASDF